MGGMLGNKRQDRGKKKFRGPEIVGGGLFGEMPKKGWKNFLAVPKSGGNFFGGHNNFLGGEFFRNNLKKKIPGGDSLENCPNKFRGDFLGGSYTGGRVCGECWEIKDKIGEKKNSGGQKKKWKNFLAVPKRKKKIQGANFRGDFLGKCQKRGGTTFWRFQKVVGIFLGVTTILGGRIFQEKFKKKKSRGGILWKLSKKNLGGIF